MHRSEFVCLTSREAPADDPEFVAVAGEDGLGGGLDEGVLEDGGHGAALLGLRRAHRHESAARIHRQQQQWPRQVLGVAAPLRRAALGELEHEEVLGVVDGGVVHAVPAQPVREAHVVVHLVEALADDADLARGLVRALVGRGLHRHAVRVQVRLHLRDRDAAPVGVHLEERRGQDGRRKEVKEVRKKERKKEKGNEEMNELREK